MVRPHATRSLCPTATPTKGGSLAPITFHPGATRCEMYLSDGFVTVRCGSLATTGLPVAASRPLTTQLLEPGLVISSPGGDGSRPRPPIQLRYGSTIAG